MLEGHTARVGKEVEFSHVLFLAFFFFTFFLELKQYQNWYLCPAVSWAAFKALPPSNCGVLILGVVVCEWLLQQVFPPCLLRHFRFGYNTFSLPLASGFSPAGSFTLRFPAPLCFRDCSSVFFFLVDFWSELLWIWILRWDLGSQDSFWVLFLCFTAEWNGVSDRFACSKLTEDIFVCHFKTLGRVYKRALIFFFVNLLQFWWLCAACMLLQGFQNVPLGCCSLPVLQVPWRGTRTSCLLGAETEWSFRGTSAPRPCSQSGGSRATGRRSVGSNGLRTTSSWPLGEMITRYSTYSWSHEARHL